MTGCRNEEHLLLKSAVIIDHLLNQYCTRGVPKESHYGLSQLSMGNKWHVLKQSVNVPVHTSLCIALFLQQQEIITEKLYYSRFNLGRLLLTLSTKYPAIADHSRRSTLLGAKYALTILCCEVFALIQ